MNRIISKRAIATGLILFIMTLCLASLSVPAYSADKVIAKLTSFSGTVLIKSKGAWGVQPEKDLPLYSDDKIVTRMGIATVTFDDGAVIDIKANSNLLIRDTEGTGTARELAAVKRQLRLILGKMLFRSGKGTGVSTTLETTTMVCGLRGTAGTLSIDAAGVTYIQFTEGGGDTIGNFISGIAPDVPAELADLNPAQKAAFVAAAAAVQAKNAADRLAKGEISEAEAALAAAKAAEAAAEEAKAAAEAMLNNPDQGLRDEAAAALAAAEAVIEAARKTIDKAVEAGATGRELGIDISNAGGAIGFDTQQLADFMDGGDDDTVFGSSYGVFGDNLKQAIDSFTSQGNESDMLPEEGDVTPPVIILSVAPVVGANENVTATLVPSYTNDEPGTVDYSYFDADTGEPVSNTGLIDGTYDILVVATDQAGNQSSTQFTFTLVNSYFFGNVSGTGSTITGSVDTGTSSIVIGQDWGQSATTMSGTWTGTHTGSLTLTAGGSGDTGYWLSQTSGSINTSTGSATGDTDYYQISQDSITRGTGLFNGNFASDGTWTGTATGEGLVTTLFDLSGAWQSYWVESNVVSSFYGYGGLTATTGGDYDYAGLGIYYESGTADSWLAEVRSEETTDVYESVALSGGVWKNETMDGFLAGVYDLDNGSTGIFFTEILGDFYPLNEMDGNSGMWKIEGTLTPVEIFDLTDPAYTGYYVADLTTENNLLFEQAMTSDLDMSTSSYSENTEWITSCVYNSTGDLFGVTGVWGARFVGGLPTSSPTLGPGWWIIAGGQEINQGPLSAWMTIGSGSDDGINPVDSGFDTDTNSLSAYIAGSWINVDDAITGVMGGKLKGSFDTTYYTWQSIAIGSLLDTKTFLEMVDNNKSALTALDIPCVQVGSTTLDGGYTPAVANIELWHATMNDVRFFAYSTGADPKIWATGDVSGTFADSAIASGQNAYLTSTSGGSIGANFSLTSWTGNNWTASVSGGGTLTRTDIAGTAYVGMNGGAAGSCAVTNSPQTGAGIFSGTASGIVSQPN